MMVLDSQDGGHLVENGMSRVLSNLADLPLDVQANIAAQTAELVAERTAHSQAIQNRDTIIADLRLQLDGRVLLRRSQARSFPNQKTEAKISAHILNKMTALGRPEFEQVA